MQWKVVTADEWPPVINSVGVNSLSDLDL